MNIPTPPDNPAGRWRNALVFCVNAVSSSVLSVCVCPTLGQTDTQTKSSRDKQRQQHKHIAMCLLTYHCCWLGAIHCQHRTIVRKNENTGREQGLEMCVHCFTHLAGHKWQSREIFFLSTRIMLFRKILHCTLTIIHSNLQTLSLKSYNK